MAYLQQVQAGIDFIETHLDTEFSLSDVATAAGLSQWHFQRIFKSLSNETLKHYIRARRLALSLDKLLHTSDKIINIAIAADYESQESYTRAFKATFGLTPNEYRKVGSKGMFLKKLELTPNYLQHIHTGMKLKPTIERRKAMLLVGLKTQLYGTDSDKNNIGHKLPPLWQVFLERLKEINHRHTQTCYGVVQQAGKYTDQLDYYAAVEVDKAEKLPKGMDVIKIPATDYAIFTHTGKADKIDDTVNYIYGNWLVQSSHRHSSGPDLEIYDHRYDGESENSIFEYGVPLGHIE
jgi:AraC family transcriptional regulator